MMNQIGIIADDLTGANDSGVQLAKKGLSSTVVFDYRHAKADAVSDVLVVDTDSRARSREEAYEAALGAARFLKDRGSRHIYKKVDSTLRGNMAAELLAVEQVFQPDLVLIAPAFPKMNRTTVNGHHYVGGVLITETEFARDPKTPVQESYIPKLLQADADRKVSLIDSDMLRLPESELRARVTAELENGNTWFVCDSQSEEELVAIASFFAKLDKQILWTGSAGLIEYLPEALQLSPAGSGDEEVALTKKTLVVSGSLSQTTRGQLQRVKEMEQAHFMEVSPEELIRQNGSSASYVEEMLNHSDKDYYVLYVDASESNRVLGREVGAELGLSLNEVSEAISSGLGQITKALLKASGEIEGLILTGGDTAKAVCTELESGEMQLYSEVEPGLPFGRLHGESGSYWAITKAGGFGNDESLVDALKYMTKQKKVRV
ncbi:Hrp-dependent type III effector protein [Paenibacillus sp. 7541]|uniref:Hrp-dependent type III effector protein n=2 Tax=Paenibacillus TaxID=44249 RepID=A0A268EG55_9BACL|nr:Hrp-dependent type III effector protein [Paenibacillus campinasensis]PAK49055.1 Hrp-dependent type III effector protein [Paenibacillus sp. 7541]